MSRPLLLILDGETLEMPGLEASLAGLGWEVAQGVSSQVDWWLSNRDVSMIVVDPSRSVGQVPATILAIHGINADVPIVLLQDPASGQGPRAIAGVSGTLDRSLPPSRWASILNGILVAHQAEKHKFTAEDLFADILADLDGESSGPAKPPLPMAAKAPTPSPDRMQAPSPQPKAAEKVPEKVEDVFADFVAPWESKSGTVQTKPMATPMEMAEPSPKAAPLPVAPQPEVIPLPIPVAEPPVLDHEPIQPVAEAPSVDDEAHSLNDAEIDFNDQHISEIVPEVPAQPSSHSSASSSSSAPTRMNEAAKAAAEARRIEDRKAYEERRGMEEPGEYLEEFGNYYLLERIAVGGMAELFKARQRGVHNFEKIVAIKRILPHLSDNDEFVRMFIDEAKLAAQLTHPNIVQIFDLGKAAGFYYIAMEYVDGKDLRSLLRKVREYQMPFPETVAAFVIMKVAGALDYAHRKKGMNEKELKLVHRDISPQNVLISSEGAVKLVDFGIAKAATKSTQTIAGALKGKLLYMSPEQALGDPLDSRSDIYSLGLVLFELLTGVRCFQADSELGVLEKVRLGKVQDVQMVNPKITREMSNIVHKALQKDVDKRYPSARMLERDLKALLSKGGNEPVEHDIAEYANVLLNGTKEQAELLVGAHFSTPISEPELPPAKMVYPVAMPESVMSDPLLTPSTTGSGSQPSWMEMPEVEEKSGKRKWILPVIAIVLAVLAILVSLFFQAK